MFMTSYVNLITPKALITRVFCVMVDDIFGDESNGIGNLKRRTRRINGFDGVVDPIVFVRRTRHTQHLTRSRFDGHNTPLLAL